jgi:(p)ppGpp synthase/HD superfamily hydrolase
MTQPNLLTQRFHEALVFAAELHAGQIRKGSGVPYIAHLLAVTSLVLENGGSEDQAIAALLHDAVEDQGGADTRERIAQRFGETVARLVDGCTDTDLFPKPAWRARKQAYLEHLRLAGEDVRLISLSDKVHNARSILEDYRNQGNAVWERFKGGREGCLWYYHELAGIFAQLGPFPLAHELSRVVAELERLTHE